MTAFIVFTGYFMCSVAVLIAIVATCAWLNINI